jgi:glycosyltransferase involved in cell wall biosynthesis
MGSGKPQPIRIVHIINSLRTGGAELVLLRLMSHANRQAFQMQAVTLAHGGDVAESLRALGFRVHCLEMGTRRIHTAGFVRLVRLLRSEKPHLVQTWLQQSDVVGGIAAKIARTGPVLWNIRHSTLHPVFTKRRTWMFTKVGARLSPYIPAHIVCCSEASRKEQVEMGYSDGKMSVIPNGVDTARFTPDPESRIAVRRELGIPPSALVLGTVGQAHPAKDYPDLIRAADRIAAQRPEAHFVFCGKNVTMEHPELGPFIKASQHRSRFHVIGMRPEVHRVMASFDVLISASRFSEGFPNVVSEAMACCIPCVVTDVGDSALILGPAGTVVPPEQPEAIVRAVLALVEAGPDALTKLGHEARRRIVEQFSLQRMVARYEELYTSIGSNARQ